MPTTPTHTLLHALTTHRLLTAPQFAELQRGDVTQEPTQLLQELVKRNWLTKFQAKHVAAGTMHELLLEPYVLLDPLGEGGMGVVFKARHTKMNRLVALKIVRKELLSHPNAIRRFEREIEAAAKLSHPNIVIAHDAAEKDGRHYFVMEYIEGIDLTKLVRRRGPLPAREACDYIRQAALGLQHAHDCGLVHRDIKPSNLMLTRAPGGQSIVVKILDLGLALLQHNDAEGLVTQEGAVMGSPDYIAPEQAVDAHRADIRSDIYSLGCTLYHLLAGQPPFAGGSLAMKIAGHLHSEPPLLEKKRPDLPRYLVLVVRKLMMKNPEQRCQLPQEVALTLEHVINTMLPETAPLLPLNLPEEPDSAAAEDAASGVTATEGATAPPAPAAPVPAPRSARPLSPREAIAVAPTVLPPQKPAPAPAPVALPMNSLSSAATVPTALPVPAPVAAVAAASGPAAGAALPVPASPLATAPVASLLPENTDVGVLSVLPSMAPSLAPLEAARTMPPLTAVLSQAVREPRARPRWQDPRWLVPVGFVCLVLLSLPFLLGRSQQPPTYREQPVDLTEKSRYSWYPKELVAVLGEDRGRHWGPVRGLACSTDGKLIVSGSDDGIIRLWEPPLLREQGRILEGKSGHKGPVLGVALSPDGRYLLSCGQDRTVRLWDLPTLKEIRQFANHGGAALVRFSLDSRSALTSTDGNVWRSYSVETGRQGEELPGRGSNVVVFRTPDDRWQIAGAPPAVGDKTVPPDAPLQLWELKTPDKPAQIFKGHSATYLSVAFAPTTRRALSSNNDGTVRLWDAATGLEVRRLTGHQTRVIYVAFSLDGRRAVTNSDDGTVKTWDALTGQELATFDGHRGPLTCLVFLPNNVHVVTGNEDCTLRLWHLDTGKELHPLGGHTRVAQSVAFSSDGRQVLSGGSDNTVHLWELRGGRDVQQEVHRFAAQAKGVPFVGFMSDERRLFSVDGDNVTRQWDRVTGQAKFTFPFVKVRPTVMGLSPDTKRLLCGGPPILETYDLATGQVNATYEGHLGATHCVAFAADGQRILSGGEDWSVRLWDLTSKQELGRYAGHTQAVRAVGFARDGQLLSTSLDATVAHWEVKGKAPLKRLELEGGLPPPVNSSSSITSVAFSPDGTLLACASQEGHIWLWDVASGKRRNANWKMPGAVLRLAWAPDSRHLGTANANGTVYVFRLGAVDERPTK